MVNHITLANNAISGVQHMAFASNIEQPSNYLAQAHLCWCIGDWLTLSQLGEKAVPESDPELGLYVLAAHYQLGNFEEAKSIFQSLNLNNEHKRTAAALLISGVFNSLAKANTCNFNHDIANQYFEKSLTYTLHQSASSALVNARATEQLAQLGLPRLANNIAPTSFSPDVQHLLENYNQHFKTEPVTEIALAEYHQQHEKYDNAIVHWQNVIAKLNSHTPQPYYDRLKDAYKQGNGFPLGKTAQETLSGDIDKHELLTTIHKTLSPDFYFEIGVQTGKSLSIAKCEAIGVDPMPLLSKNLNANAKVITASSDVFFSHHCDLLLGKSIDLSFIDGMHLFEYVLRDFINVERYSRPHTLIVVDDIFPGHPDQANRKRCTKAWTGDVWKLKTVLEQYRPDLVTLAINAYPTGLLFIANLDPDNTELISNYEHIVEEYAKDINPPETVIQRDNAISGKASVINEFLVTLNQAKKINTNPDTIQISLMELLEKTI